MPVSDLYKCSHCCQIWLMTLVQSCADSPQYKDIFFFSWYETLLKNVTQSYLALDIMCYHHCTVNWDWLVTSCDKVGKALVFVLFSFPQKKTRKRELNCVKPLPSVLLNNKQKQNKFILILKATVCMQCYVCVWSYIEWIFLKVCQRKYYWFLINKIPS